MMAKVYAIQTGAVKIRLKQMAATAHGPRRMLDVLVDDQWSDWLPIYAWLIEHEDGPILVDTGETARVHERGYHPRWHPFYRRASQFRVRPDDEIGPALRALGVAVSDIRHVVLTRTRELSEPGISGALRDSGGSPAPWSSGPSRSPIRLTDPPQMMRDERVAGC